MEKVKMTKHYPFVLSVHILATLRDKKTNSKWLISKIKFIQIATKIRKKKQVFWHWLGMGRASMEQWHLTRDLRKRRLSRSRKKTWPRAFLENRRTRDNIQRHEENALSKKANNSLQMQSEMHWGRSNGAKMVVAVMVVVVRKIVKGLIMMYNNGSANKY